MVEAGVEDGAAAAVAAERLAQNVLAVALAIDLARGVASAAAREYLDEADAELMEMLGSVRTLILQLRSGTAEGRSGPTPG